jgi:hypothetical protein
MLRRSGARKLSRAEVLRTCQIRSLLHLRSCWHYSPFPPRTFTVPFSVRIG